jgi:hypothetical protein
MEVVLKVKQFLQVSKHDQFFEKFKVKKFKVKCVGPKMKNVLRSRS